MRIAVTGFVSDQAGSVASANAVILRELLTLGVRAHFFSKASFVDPRPAVGTHPGFGFSDVDNRFADRTRARLSRVPVFGKAAALLDAASYNRLLVRRINQAQAQNPFDLCLWLGDYAAGSVAGIPSLSFVQGPPGTDARSFLRRFEEIRRLAGTTSAWKWRILAALRLSRVGLPPFRHSDAFVLGSRQSAHILHTRYGISENKIAILPYPIDLEMFKPGSTRPTQPPLRALWLGRIIPRKRLDLFLNGAATAIQDGLDLKISIVGGSGLIPGYQRLIAEFPHPERLEYQSSLERQLVPQLMAAHDVLVQPSEEENFGSSVAEAQACGLPVIVGASNGNADYLCRRDIQLHDYEPATLARALAEIATRRKNETPEIIQESRSLAEHSFAPKIIARHLLQILEGLVSK